MSKWQDISTAPKDGTYILVHQTGTLAPNDFVVYFDRSWSDDGWWLTCDGKDPELPLRGPEPTHWMPLPKPPKPINPNT